MMSKLNRKRCVPSENEILQYSTNLTCMRMDDRFQIIKYSTLSDTTYIDIPFLQVVFCYCFYSWPLQKSEVYFILDVSINS